MAETVQMQLQVIDNRVLKEWDRVTLSPISRNTPTQEITSEKSTRQVPLLWASLSDAARLVNSSACEGSG